MTDQQIKLQVSPNVSKGLATVAGILVALAQYLAAIVVFLEADDQLVALAPLGTATTTFLAVVVGRFVQANTALKMAGKIVETDVDREPEEHVVTDEDEQRDLHEADEALAKELSS